VANLEDEIRQGHFADDVRGVLTGVALWLAYGILQAEIPTIIWNAVTLLLALAMVVMKIKYG
jgi:uncharacterized protein with PQ loop repeat